MASTLAVERRFAEELEEIAALLLAHWLVVGGDANFDYFVVAVLHGGSV